MTQDEEFKAAVQRLEDNCVDSEDIVLFDGRGMGYTYLDALIGISHDERPIYDYDLMVDYLVNKGDMTREEAVEWIDYNTIGSLAGASAYGEKTPIIMYKFMEG